MAGGSLHVREYGIRKNLLRRGGDVRETENFGFHKNAAVAGRIEFYGTGKPGVRLVSTDPGDGIRGVVWQDADKILCGCDI